MRKKLTAPLFLLGLLLACGAEGWIKAGRPLAALALAAPAAVLLLAALWAQEGGKANGKPARIHRRAS